MSLTTSPEVLRDLFLDNAAIRTAIDTRLVRVAAPDYKHPVPYVVYTLLSPGNKSVLSGRSSRQTDVINYLFVHPKSFKEAIDLLNLFLNVVPLGGGFGEHNSLCISKVNWLLDESYEEGFDHEVERFYVSVNLEITYGV